MTPDEIGYQIGFWIGKIVGAVVIGALCGTPSLIIGIVKKRHGFAWSSWIVCTLGGILWGVLLAGPLMLVFTIIALCLKKRPARAVTLHDTSVPSVTP